MNNKKYVFYFLLQVHIVLKSCLLTYERKKKSCQLTLFQLKKTLYFRSIFNYFSQPLLEFPPIQEVSAFSRWHLGVRGSSCALQHWKEHLVSPVGWS